LNAAIWFFWPFHSPARREPSSAPLVLLNSGDDDLLVARVTTSRHASKFDVVIQDWCAAGLLAPSSARLNKLATVEKASVRRRLGRLQEAGWSTVCKVLRTVFSE
jgi:mRNA interferase MazF